jgi:hypothetical protein
MIAGHKSRCVTLYVASGHKTGSQRLPGCEADVGGAGAVENTRP